jgi:Glycosyltransferase family 87
VRISAYSSRFYRNLFYRLVILGFVILLLLFAGKYLYYIWNNLRIVNIWFSDFLAVFDCARAPDIYDQSKLDAFQEALGSQHFPCPYPPSFYFLISPIGLMDFYPAYAAWILGTFALYLAVSCHRKQSHWATFIIVFAPATVLTFAFGQTGLLTSALMVGGFRLIANRPVVSGIFFGLVPGCVNWRMSYPSRFGILARKGRQIFVVPAKAGT